MSIGLDGNLYINLKAEGSFKVDTEQEFEPERWLVDGMRYEHFKEVIEEAIRDWMHEYIDEDPESVKISKLKINITKKLFEEWMTKNGYELAKEEEDNDN